MAQNIEIIPWDGYIENDNDFPEITLLEPGDYNFEVIDLEKTYSSTTNVPMAKLTLRVFDNEKNSTNVWDNLILQRNCEWKLSQFFRSIGLKKRGERFYFDWNKVEGAKGRCKIKKSTYTNAKGKEVEKNEIERYYEPKTTPPEDKNIDNPWVTN